MSYHIVKSIKIDKKLKKVFITGCDNNVSPRTPYRWECTYYGDRAREEKWEMIEIDILRAYEEGNFQPGTSNKYTRALKVLRDYPEYKNFNWRLGGIGKEYEETSKRRKEKIKEFDKLLKRALNTKLPKEKWVITKKNSGWNTDTIYAKWRKNGRFMRWDFNKSKAKKFDFKEEAQQLKDCFTGSSNWKIEMA